MKIVSREIAWQRLEGLVLFLAATSLYDFADFSWWWFVLGFLAVDISMIGYIINNRAGAFVYNMGHSLALPVLISAMAVWQASSFGLALSLVWLAHIGIDRAMGFGLKTDKGFNHTHLGKIGK